MARTPETPLGRFLRHHSQMRLNELGRAIGETGLTRQVSRVQQNRTLLRPEVLDKIAQHLDPVGQRMLVTMMARDAGLPGHTEVGTDDDAHLTKITHQIEHLTRDEKFDLIVWLVRSVEHG